MDKYYNQIKEALIDDETYSKVKDFSKNKHRLHTYYNVGKILIEAQGGERAKYGDRLIKEYSNKLVNDVGKKFDTTTLKRIRQFYLIIEKGAMLWHQLSWSHYRELIPLKNIDKINYYAEISVKQNLSISSLRRKMKNNEYERLPDKTKQKLIKKQENEIEDFIKNPIIIKNNHNYKHISEKILKQLILEDIDNFLIELGDGFSYIANEYKIKIGSRFNYIDFLLYNIKYNCYVVIELKITELKKSHLGQIQVYMNYINDNLKTISQNKTIGIIIVKEENKLIMKYCSDDRIFSSGYKLS